MKRFRIFLAPLLLGIAACGSASAPTTGGSSTPVPIELASISLPTSLSTDVTGTSNLSVPPGQLGRPQRFPSPGPHPTGA